MADTDNTPVTTVSGNATTSGSARNVTISGSAPGTSALTTDAATQGDNANGGGTQPVEKTFTQAEMNAAIDARLKREREKGERDAAKIKADAETDAAKRNGEWQTLAQKHEARVKELEALEPQLTQTQAERDELNGAISKLLESERTGLPDYVLELLDGQSAVKQLDWLAKNKATLTAKQFARVPGTPAADDAKKLSESEIQRRRAEVSRYIGR